MASFYLVDDAPEILELAGALIERAGHRVWSSASGTQALDDIPDKRPDCVIVDIMMPGIDGLELCRRLKSMASLEGTRIIVLSAKAYDFDRRRARELGADGYLVKPIDPESFVTDLEAILWDRATVTFWGTRGTLPVPGGATIRFGGNTACVLVEFSGDRLFIFDAGSGIRALSDHLMSTERGRIAAKIFISHPHWDHINALPFFAPLYAPGNDLEILGAQHGELTTRELIAAQMDGVYFPVTMREFGANVTFRDLREESIEVAGVRVRTMLLNHPGNCLGYRIDREGYSICYATDNELFPKDDPRHDAQYVERFTDFVRGVDVLITDVTYTDEEYRHKRGWGHSGVAEVVELADRAEVGSLYLFHHDPSQNDDAVQGKLELAEAQLEQRKSATRCFAPPEGYSITLQSRPDAARHERR